MFAHTYIKNNTCQGYEYVDNRKNVLRKTYTYKTIMWENIL
mgnify:CR=1 FL=1